MAASLGALRNDDVGTTVDGAFRVRTGLQLAKEGDPGGFDLACERFGVIKRQEDRTGAAT